MKSGFEISKDQSLPEESALWTFADLAIKGAWKTYAACVLAEEMVEHDVPIVALDGIGIWWGLRVGVNGHKGLPIVVFGGAHKDLPIPATFGKHKNLVVDEPKLQLMVKAILEAGISAVVDTSEFSKSMQRRIVATFVNELYHLNSQYDVRHVFIEEADLWIPQRIVGDVAFSAGAIDDLVRRGGNFNLGCTLISQRHAVVNKDVLTQAGCLFILRTVHDLDKKAVRAWVENVAHPNDPKLRKWYDGLRDLKDGEGWIWHPTDPVIFKKVQFRERHTLHATREFFRTPDAKRAEKVDVSEFIEKFKKVFEPPKPVEKPPETSPGSERRTLPIVPQPVSQLIPQRAPIMQSLPVTDDRPTADFQVRKPIASDEVRKPALQASDRDVIGRLLYAVMKGEFDERQTAPKTIEILSHYGWLHERREVEQGLLQLCDLKFFTRRISTGNMYWYFLESDAKQRIVLLEVNAV